MELKDCHLCVISQILSHILALENRDCLVIILTLKELLTWLYDCFNGYCRKSNVSTAACRSSEDVLGVYKRHATCYGDARQGSGMYSMSSCL